MFCTLSYVCNLFVTEKQIPNSTANHEDSPSHTTSTTIDPSTPSVPPTADTSTQDDAAPDATSQQDDSSGTHPRASNSEDGTGGIDASGETEGDGVGGDGSGVDGVTTSTDGAITGHTSSAIVHQGVLKKQKNYFNKHYAPCHFVLKGDGRLYWYKASDITYPTAQHSQIKSTRAV